MHLNLQVVGLDRVRAAMAQAAGQVPFAIARAITWTAQDVRDAERQEIKTVFGNPTRYTQNAVYMERATKLVPEAEVWLRGDGSRKNEPGRHYLRMQIEGGARPVTGFESRMVQVGYMQRGERAVPGAGAKLDAYGNIKRGQIVQILSQLKAATLLGDFSNATNSARSRRNRSREAYFFSAGKGAMPTGSGAWKGGKKRQHLARGIWVRISFGASITVVLPVLLFVDGARYRRRLDFFGVAQRVATRKFPENWDRSWADAMRTRVMKGQGALF